MATTHSRGKSAMGGSKSKSKSKKSGKKPHSIHVRRGKSGGFIAEHHYKADGPDQMAPESEEHVLPDMDSLQAHMADHMGDQDAQQAPPAAPDAAAAAAAGPAAPPPAAAPGPQAAM